MAPRAYWKGHVRLSLVSFPVQLFSATATGSRIGFHQIHRRAGSGCATRRPSPASAPVDKDEIVKGYEVAKDSYVTFADEELEAIRVESRHTIDLVQFVGACEIDPLYYEKPYFLVPDGDGGAGGVPGDPPGADRHGPGRPGPGRAVGARELRGAQAVRQGHAARDAAHGGRRSGRARPTSPRSRTGRSTQDQLALARQLIERKQGPFDPAASSTITRRRCAS